MDHSRIIRGAVGGGRYTVTAPITQWDYGYLFLPEIEDLPATYRLDFSNDEHHGTALSVYCGSEGGEVPEELIDTGKDIFVWFFYVGDGFGKTEYKWRIPNKCKPKGGGETPEPSQQSSIDQLIVRSNAAVEDAEQAVIDAAASATAAGQSAENAHDSAVDAQNYAESAQTSANNASASASQASASATASAQSASQSAQIKSDVEGMVDDAQASASASAQSATASANSASQASASATSASQSATSAQGYASQAQTSAQTATTKASEASTSASTASAKATESAQSASQALTYKTDAESAKTASQTAQTSAESARDSAISAKDDAESARDEAQNIVDGISGKVEQIDSNTERIESLEDDRYKPYVVDSASGSIASFPDGADDIPLKSLIVDINPVQDLSQGDPSPENICPISGWTEVEVNHSDADMTNPTTITIQLGQTVYGGKLDVLSGALTVERAMVILDGTESWSKPDNGFLTAKYKSDKSYPDAICSTYIVAKSYSGVNGTDKRIAITTNGIRLHDSQFANATALKTYLAENNVQLCYNLATPIEIQLTPHEVNSLLGVNNIFADTGDCSVEYRADTKLYIEKLTQPEEDDMIADSAITSGQFFMVGNSLYRALTNIASGATITVGTNAQRVSLSDALNLVNA